MKVRIEFTVDIDPDAWNRKFGTITRDEVRRGIKRHGEETAVQQFIAPTASRRTDKHDGDPMEGAGGDRARGRRRDRSLAGGIAKLQREVLAGPCGIGRCTEPSVGFIQGMFNPAVGVWVQQAKGAKERGYDVYTEPFKTGREACRGE